MNSKEVKATVAGTMVLKKLGCFFTQCSCWSIMLLNRINLPWYFVIPNLRETEDILQCDSQLKSANSALGRMDWKGTNNKNDILFTW